MDPNETAQDQLRAWAAIDAVVKRVEVTTDGISVGEFRRILSGLLHPDDFDNLEFVLLEKQMLSKRNDRLYAGPALGRLD